MKELINYLFQYIPPFPQILIFSLVSAAAIWVLVEAVSFHGADNLTIQIAASGVTYLFIQIC